MFEMQISEVVMGVFATYFLAGIGFVIWLVRLEGKVNYNNKSNNSNRSSIEILYQKNETTNASVVVQNNDIVAIRGDVKVTDEKFNTIHRDLNQINKKLDKLLE